MVRLISTEHQINNGFKTIRNQDQHLQFLHVREKKLKIFDIINNMRHICPKYEFDAMLPFPISSTGKKRRSRVCKIDEMQPSVSICTGKTHSVFLQLNRQS